MTRRQLILGMPAFLENRPQRVVILMVDGLGADYIAASQMPVLTSWQKEGIAKIVGGVMPSVTNANNTSICCGAWPEEHGITANFYLNETTGREEYMEDASLVRVVQSAASLNDDVEFTKSGDLLADPDDLFQRFPLQEFHRNEGHTLSFVDVINGDDVGMAELAR